jgi:hypothetical protein
MILIKFQRHSLDVPLGLKIDFSNGAMVIAHMIRGSPIHKAGLRAGMTLQTINSLKCTSINQVKDQLNTVGWLHIRAEYNFTDLEEIIISQYESIECLKGEHVEAKRATTIVTDDTVNSDDSTNNSVLPRIDTGRNDEVRNDLYLSSSQYIE